MILGREGQPSRRRNVEAGCSRSWLALARHFVELHGGTITAESQGEGKGSTFTIELPLER